MSDSGGDGVWRIHLEIPFDYAEQFAAALEPYCDAVTFFENSDGGPWTVEGWCHGGVPDQGGLAMAIKNAAGGTALSSPPAFTITPVAARDWVADSLDAMPVLNVGRYFVYGSHYQGSFPGGRIRIAIDAGNAFGSGRHESTAGCLLALSDLSRQKFYQPLDMGCGSGILAIAMARTWRVPVMAVDNDVAAVKMTAFNARKNHLAPIIRAFRSDGYGAGEISRAGPYDLIVANILANPLCAMARDLSRHLASNGIAVLAGFLEPDARRVQVAHRHFGLRPVRRINVKGWQTLVLKKQA